MIELLKDTNIDFIAFRKKAFTFSAILVLLGIMSFVMLLLGKGNISVDFTGGSNLQVEFQKPVDIAEVREVLGDGGIGDVQVQQIRNTNQFLIKTKVGHTPEQKIENRIDSILKTGFPANSAQILSSTMVGPGVGKQLKNYAIIAVILALAGIIVYIAYRFTFLSGIAATVATFHDVVAVMGLFWILNKEFNLLIITALLTVAGYSLQDTVVVFDRIRENMGKMKSKDDFGNVINRSINEVLSRTVVTGITTLLALGAIMLLGGEVLFDFALALFVGLIVGTYSSIFVASPLLYMWRKRAL
jgi:preprotein translocase subunit SecF